MNHARHAVLMAAFACLTTGGASTQQSANFVDTHAEQIVRAARTAVGRGPQAVERLQSLILRGRSRVAVEGVETLVSGDVEIRALLPRHFMRIDRTGGSERTTGLAGTRLLSVIREGDVVEEPPQRLRGDLVKAQRAWYGRLMLGTTTYVLPDQSLTFRAFFRNPSQTTGDLRDGTLSLSREGLPDPNIVEATGADGVFLRLFLDGARLPDRLEYRAGRSATGTMRFSDRRDVGGLLLPHRVVTMMGDRVVDELLFSEILVNPELSEAAFR